MLFSRILKATFTANGPFMGHVDVMFSPQTATAQAAICEVTTTGDCEGWVGISGFFTRTAKGADKAHTLFGPTSPFTHENVSGITFVVASTTSDLDVSGSGLVFLTE
jgi:hypothetical protein